MLARHGYTVVLTDLVVAGGRAAARQLEREGLAVVFHRLDVTSDQDVKAVKKFVQQRFGRLDVLVNNAGILIDEERSVLKVGADVFHKVFDVNTLGALRLSQAFIPMMVRRDYGRIVNLASGRGQLSGEDEYSMMDTGPSYNLSKAALNALTIMLANATAGTNVLVNSLCPGWCRTDLGGPEAPRSAKKGAETAVWLATLPDDGPTGGFFRDKKPIPW